MRFDDTTRPARVVVAFPDRVTLTRELPDGRVLGDIELVGDPPPSAPLVGRRVTLIALEK